MVVTYPCTGLIAPNAMEVLMRSPSGWGTHGVPDRVLGVYGQPGQSKTEPQTEPTRSILKKTEASKQENNKLRNLSDRETPDTVGRDRHTLSSAWTQTARIAAELKRRPSPQVAAGAPALQPLQPLQPHCRVQGAAVAGPHASHAARVIYISCTCMQPLGRGPRGAEASRTRRAASPTRSKAVK